MSEWIQASEKILEKIKNDELKDRDRLDLVKSSLFLVKALQVSMWVWRQWLKKTDELGRFPQEELEKINKKLSEFTRSFIEYDLEMTKLGESLGVTSIIDEKKKPKVYVF